MKTRAAVALAIAAAALIILHQDFWLWGNGTLVLGLFPIGLFYHVLYCLAASALMLGLTRRAWPDHLDREAARPADGGEGPWR